MTNYSEWNKRYETRGGLRSQIPFERQKSFRIPHERDSEECLCSHPTDKQWQISSRKDREPRRRKSRDSPVKQMTHGWRRRQVGVSPFGWHSVPIWREQLLVRRGGRGGRTPHSSSSTAWVGAWASLPIQERPTLWCQSTTKQTRYCLAFRKALLLARAESIWKGSTKPTDFPPRTVFTQALISPPFLYEYSGSQLLTIFLLLPYLSRLLRVPFFSFALLRYIFT